MDWPSRTQVDLENFKEIIIQNHPAVVVPKNEFPSFHDWLEKGFCEASKMAKSAHSIEAYISCMRFFAAGFHDGHLRFGAKPLPDYSWPGFLLSWQNGKVVISSPDQSKKELPTESSEVTLINNEKATSFIERYLFPHLREDSQVERKWIKATAIALVDSQRFGQPEISEITYRDSDGIDHTYPLQKNKIKHKELINKLEKTCLEDDHEFRIEPFSDHGIWLSIPSFDSTKQLEKLISKLPELRDCSPIVFDIRGNTGGDSIWAVRILEALYGLEYLSSVSWPEDVKGYAEVRATEEGLRRFENALLLETDPEIKQLISAEIKKLNDALLQGKETYTRSMDINYFDFSKKPHTHSTLNPILGQVYLLTDHTCFSSGLMFADLILSIPGVKHIGQDTDGDTVFSQPSAFELESQLGRVICPTMIKRNRARKDNEPLSPEKVFPGPINNFQALKKWVIENTTL